MFRGGSVGVMGGERMRIADFVRGTLRVAPLVISYELSI